VSVLGALISASLLLMLYAGNPHVIFPPRHMVRRRVESLNYPHESIVAVSQIDTAVSCRNIPTPLRVVTDVQPYVIIRELLNSVFNVLPVWHTFVRYSEVHAILSLKSDYRKRKLPCFIQYIQFSFFHYEL
jgi:hypothetical protein